MCVYEVDEDNSSDRGRTLVAKVGGIGIISLIFLPA